MTKKKYEAKCLDINAWYVERSDGETIVFDLFKVDAGAVTNELNRLADENEQLKQSLHNKMDSDAWWEKKATERVEELEKENEQLKQTINEVKTDEKQLSISFMDYKMQLIEVLQQNYNYAYSQRQKNLDKSIVARTYEVLAQTVYHIAETMNVDIERFPRDGDSV
ncbi:MAG: hypothetical protein IJP99_09870 [Methanobrevibacter sp.]|nr:hypothetical protein [Methanobrevibacter sp.]